MSLSTAVPALMLDAASALWWARVYRHSWLLLVGLVLVAMALTAAMLRASVPLGDLGIGWIGLSLVYLGLARRAPMTPEAAAMFYLATYGLLVARRPQRFSGRRRDSRCWRWALLLESRPGRYAWGMTITA